MTDDDQRASMTRWLCSLQRTAGDAVSGRVGASGGYRTPDLAARILSVISEENHRQWFQQIWNGLTGASTKRHPAPYPLELAQRLVRMFSFVGDTVLDPFAGTGTTSVAAALWGRNSIGFEIDETYLAHAAARFSKDTTGLFNQTTLTVNGHKT